MEQVRKIEMNGAFAVALEGHITSANAAQIEAQLMALLEGQSVKELVVDADKLNTSPAPVCV